MTVLWGMDNAGDTKEIVICRENAVFRMDGTGRWHNRHGPFKHPKIIRYFNQSIQKDEDGFFVSQHHCGIIEKVYFPYVVTALFVVDLIEDHGVRVKLNTQPELDLIPEKLFFSKEDLYYRLGDDIAKFNPRALLKISTYIEYDGKAYRINIASDSHVIVETPLPD
jgi:hypothetical protein